MGQSGQRSLARSALVEAVGQLSRALGQIAALPATPARRREQIKLQVELIIPLFHVKGYAAPETKAAVERARLLIEQAETLGEPLQDPLLLFTVLYGFWAGSYVAFNGDMARELATQFLALAEKQGAAPLVFGHSFVGFSLLCTGGAAESRAHDDQVIALYDPAEHRPLAARFGHDVRVAALCCRSWGLWSLGYPEAARAAADQAISDAREIGQAATLMFALSFRNDYLRPLRKLRGSQRARRRACRVGGRERCCIMESVGNDELRLRIWSNRQSLGRHDCLRARRMAVNGGNGACAVALIKFDESLCGNRPIR